MDIEAQIQKSKIEKRITAIWFGILAGLAFAFVAWGIAGFQLMRSNGIFPWLAFILGAVPCMLSAILAALITIRINHLLATPFIWAANGAFFAYIGGHVTFQYISAALKILSPDIAARVSYPTTTLVEGRQVLLYMIIIVLSAIVGLLSSFLIDNASGSMAPMGRVIPALVWIAFFSLSGYVVFNNMVQPLYPAVVSTNHLIQFALDHEGQTVDIETANSIHLRAMESIQDLLHQPRRLILATYDEEFTNITVAVDFGGTWVNCSVIQNLVNFCEKTK